MGSIPLLVVGILLLGGGGGGHELGGDLVGVPLLA